MRHYQLIPFLCALFFSGNVNAVPIVYELFTSQGCSSCPPADRLAKKYADNPNILLLSYHVDYWNRLGWKDPYSSAQSTQRQNVYAAYFGTRRVYTPQAVIQGKYDVVGSDAAGIDRALTRAGSAKQWIIPQIEEGTDELRITLPQLPKINANILLIGYDKNTSNVVPRGENRGEELSHRNSVTDIVHLGSWAGDIVTLSHPIPKGDGKAVLIQDAKTGSILGAHWK